MTPLYVFGLDLGQLQDYSALGIVEAIGTPYTFEPTAEDLVESWADQAADEIIGPPVDLNLRWLERYQLGTSYPNIVRGVLDRRRRVQGASVLSLDATGVGRAVVDLFREAGVPSINVTITSGKDVTIDGAELGVPKRDLVHALLVAMQQERFHASNQLPLADVFLKEMANFRLKFTKAGNDTYEAWRESEHDDLVLAVAIACWVAEQEIAARFTQALAERQIAAFERSTKVAISAY